MVGVADAAAPSANISRSYHTTDTAVTLKSGSLVSLATNRSDYVTLASTANAKQLIGVAVASKDSLLAVNTSSSTVQVSTSGIATALVSTLGGDINIGDQIAVSPFAGVGAKATPGARIIGLAQTTFNAHTDGATTQTITDKANHSRQIALGYVRIGIAVGTAGGTSSGEQLSGLQRFARSLTGKTVPLGRIIISIIVALVALIALVTVIYASIFSGIISIGRNPLARYAVIRSLTMVLAMAVLVAVVAITTIFFLLK